MFKVNMAVPAKRTKPETKQEVPEVKQTPVLEENSTTDKPEDETTLGE